MGSRWQEGGRWAEAPLSPQLGVWQAHLVRHDTHASATLLGPSSVESLVPAIPFVRRLADSDVGEVELWRGIGGGGRAAADILPSVGAGAVVLVGEGGGAGRRRRRRGWEGEARGSVGKIELKMLMKRRERERDWRKGGGKRAGPEFECDQGRACVHAWGEENEGAAKPRHRTRAQF